jgi:(p)ppGpp synthase/HD superfamily hydrolase
MPEIQDRHRKQLSVMRGFLEGRGFYVAAEALEMVRKVSDGVRKDGITPQFHHQLSVSRLVSTLLPHLTYPEETLAAAFLHDHLEDHGDECSRENLEARFGKRIADAVWTLSKKSNGMTKSYEAYYGALVLCPIGSVVKLADRAHNIQTMHGVFDHEKQRAYIGEVDRWYFPMIRQARREHPRQYGAYENLKILLRCQCRLVEHVLEASCVQPVGPGT